MSNLEFLEFVINYWKEINESPDAICEELEHYQGDHRLMAFDYSQEIIEDTDEWTPYWVNKAKDVIDSVIYQQNEETKLLLAVGK